MMSHYQYCVTAMRLIFDSLYFFYHTDSATHLNKSRVAVTQFVNIHSQVKYDIKLFLLLK